MSALPGLNQYLTPQEPDEFTLRAEQDEATLERFAELMADSVQDEPGVFLALADKPHGSPSYEQARHRIQALGKGAWNVAVEERAQELREEV